MSVITTSTSLPCSKARYSATVSPKRGASKRSMTGSLARLMKATKSPCEPLERLPVERVLVMREPQRDEHDHELGRGSCLDGTRTCMREDAGGDLRDGSPAQEKIGSFWPLTRVFKPSMHDSPVSMNSCGRSRATGLSGKPDTGAQLLRHEHRQVVERLERAAEDAVEHARRQRRPLDRVREDDLGVVHVEAAAVADDLDQHRVALDPEHLALRLVPVGKDDREPPRPCAPR